MRQSGARGTTPRRQEGQIMNISVHQVVLDCTDARESAEFYRQLLGFEYIPGDAELVDPDWLAITAPDGSWRIAFQQIAALPAGRNMAGRRTPPDVAPGLPRRHRRATRRRAFARNRTGCATVAGSAGRSRRADPNLCRPGRPPILHLRESVSLAHLQISSPHMDTRRRSESEIQNWGADPRQRRPRPPTRQSPEHRVV